MFERDEKAIQLRQHEASKNVKTGIILNLVACIVGGVFEVLSDVTPMHLCDLVCFNNVA